MCNQRSLALACLLACPGVLAVPAAAQETGPPASRGAAAEAAVAAIIAEHDQAQQDFYVKLEGIEDEDEVNRIYSESYPHAAPYVERVHAALAGHEAEPGAVAGLIWIVQQGQEDTALGAARDALLAHHLAAPELAGLVERMGWGWSPDEETFLRRVADAAPARELKGKALFALAQRMTNGGGGGDEGSRRQAREAEALFLRIGEQYADVASGGSTLGSRAEPFLFALRNLAIGMTAPDIEGTDVDGATFRLSEFRGKVVVLDFWGFW